MFNYLCKSQAHRWGSVGTAADPEQLLPWAKLHEITQLQVGFTVQAQRTGVARHLERQEYKPQLTNCKDLTPSLSPRINHLLWDNFCLFHTGLCIPLELKKEVNSSVRALQWSARTVFSSTSTPFSSSGEWHQPYPPPPPPRVPTRTVQLPCSGTSIDTKLISAACEVQTPVHFGVTIQQSGGFTS